MTHKEMALKNLTLALEMLNDSKRCAWIPPGGRANIIKLFSSATRYIEGLESNPPDFAGLGKYIVDCEPSLNDPEASLILEAKQSFEKLLKKRPSN